MEQKFWRKVVNFITNRLLILFITTALSFYFLVVKLFTLQIVEGESYQSFLQLTTTKEVTINAPRGTIHDRYGRPLAINESAYTIKIDPNVIGKGDINSALYDLILLLEKNGEKYVDDFPISLHEPYVFLFDDNKEREKDWKENMVVDENLTAPETIEFLRKKFEIDENLSSLEARKLLSLRSAVYMQRYRKHEHITICFDVKSETVVSIEENNDKFTGIYVDVDFLRNYPQGKYFSHIIGYIRALNKKEELEMFGEGYSYYDIVGKSGIEMAFERELSGTKGSKVVEVTNLDKQLRTLKVNEPIQGSKIFLTLDAELQKKAYDILEETLKEVLVNKLSGLSSREAPITQKQFFKSLVNCNTISLQDIFSSLEESYSNSVKQYVLGVLPNAQIKTKEEIDNVKEIIEEGIESGSITPLQMILTMHEQKLIPEREDYIERIKLGKITTLQVILDSLNEGIITPQMTNLDPCTGSVVVSDVNNGDVLVAVSYPSFDNNQFVNTFNNEYYRKLNEDLTRPMYNRPFSEQRAPGSTFKMITAIAALEKGVVNPSTLIYDQHTFTKAGTPTTSCWSSGSHGSVNAATALEVSCNYYFCEASYIMGNSKSGNQFDSIRALNEYMIAFGLNEATGVEIGERNKNLEEGMLVISSPEYKKYLWELYNPNQPNHQDANWYDGDTVKTSIGQAKNNYTSANMAKYIATLATKGVRYKFHLLDKIETQKGELVEQYSPIVETIVKISPETLKTVYDGMLLVTEGTRGTAKEVFKDFPVRVAGKTGTAEENKLRNDHSSFGGFAPFEDPQISIYVMMPYGDTKTTIAPASQVAKKVIAEYLRLDKQADKGEETNVISP